MKLFKNIAIAVLLLAFVPISGSAEREKPKKKLGAGAYIASAKIEIVSGDLERFSTAIQYLNDLTYWYGPHAEALFWMGKIEVDYIDQTPSPMDKMEHVERLVAFKDSLHMCCDNKDIKKKYRKNCDQYLEKSDSTIVKFWREFYNAGIILMNDNIDAIKEDITNETDSAVIVRFQEDLQANVDSIVANFELCIILDESNSSTYAGFGAVYDKIEDYENAIKWRVKGLEQTDDKVKLLQTIAYNYISMGDYAGAIPYMRDYLALAPDDILTMGNLAICYNSQKMFDSSFAVNLRVLAADTANVDALISVGHFYRQVFIDAADSARSYTKAENEVEAKKWEQTKKDYIDSTLAYYKRVIDVAPKNEQIQYLYATYNYIISNWELAIVGFKAATEINPTEIDYWKSLGDSYIQTKEFAGSAAAYEKAVEINPSDKAVWEQLVSLYGELKRTKDKANAEKQVKALE